jgi:hypothetical protein
MIKALCKLDDCLKAHLPCVESIKTPDHVVKVGHFGSQGEQDDDAQNQDPRDYWTRLTRTGGP